MAPEVWAAEAHVHGNIQHPAAHGAHQLALAPRVLQMQPPQHASGRARHVVLHKWPTDTAVRVAGRLKGFEMEAPRVAEKPGLDYQDFREIGDNDVHRQCTWWGEANSVVAIPNLVVARHLLYLGMRAKRGNDGPSGLTRKRC